MGGIPPRRDAPQDVDELRERSLEVFKKAWWKQLHRGSASSCPSFCSELSASIEECGVETKGISRLLLVKQRERRSRNKFLCYSETRPYGTRGCEDHSDMTVFST